MKYPHPETINAQDSLDCIISVLKCLTNSNLNGKYIFSLLTLWGITKSIKEIVTLPLEIMVHIMDMANINNFITNLKSEGFIVQRLTVDSSNTPCSIRIYYKNKDYVNIIILHNNDLTTYKYYDFRRVGQIGGLTTIYNEFEFLIKKEYFDNKTQVIFNSIPIYVPDKSKEFISNMYGEWNELSGSFQSKKPTSARFDDFLDNNNFVEKRSFSGTHYRNSEVDNWKK